MYHFDMGSNHMTINQSFILQNTCIHESVSYLQWILFQLQTGPLLYSPYLWTISGNILCTPWNKYNSLHTVTEHAINLLDISLSNLDQTDNYLFSIDHYQKLINPIKKKLFSMMVLKLCEQSLRGFFLSVPQLNLSIISTEYIFTEIF